MEKFARSLALLFVVAGFNAAATVTPLPGTSPQTVSEGDNLAPWRVLVTDASGNPMPNYTVRWYLPFPLSGPSGILAHDDRSNCTVGLGYDCRVKTNAQGVAQLNATHAVQPGSVAISVISGTGEADYLGSASLEVTVLDRSIPPGTSFQGIWWVGPQENGWGVTVAQPLQGGRLLPTILFVYDEAGNPTWEALDEFRWLREGMGEGRVYAPRGSPYFAYDASRFAPGANVAEAVLEFHSDRVATMSYFPDPAGTRFYTRKSLRPFDFDAGQVAPRTGYEGLWWGGPSQAGWAVSLAEGGGGLFGLWLTYDENGNRTWFSMPSGTWSGSTYSGTIYRTRGPTWPSYDASKLVVEPAGTFILAFEDLNNATFSWNIGSRAQVSHIVRYAP